MTHDQTERDPAAEFWRSFLLAVLLSVLFWAVVVLFALGV